MPTYSYSCKTCGHAFDITQAFSDASLTVCPECDGALRKVFGNVGISFKGSGFYRTDSKSGSSTIAGSTPAKEKSTASASASTSTGSASSESSSASTTASAAPAKAAAAAS